MPTINFHLWIKQVSGPDQREAFQGGLPVEWWQGEQPAHTKAFNKCIAITAGTCLGAARSSNIISGCSCSCSCSVPQLLSCSFEPKSKPDGPAGEQLNCHLGFSVFPSCLSPVAVAVVWLQILKLQLLALHMQLQLFHLPQLSHSPQIFKCLACDFSWSQRNGMESLGLARVSNDCGLRRRRRWRWRPGRCGSSEMCTYGRVYEYYRKFSWVWYYKYYICIKSSKMNKYIL